MRLAKVTLTVYAVLEEPRDTVATLKDEDFRCILDSALSLHILFLLSWSGVRRSSWSGASAAEPASHSVTDGGADCYTCCCGCHLAEEA